MDLTSGGRLTMRFDKNLYLLEHLIKDDATGSKKKVKEAGLDPLSRTSPRDSPRESLIPTTCPSFMKSSLSTPPLLHFWRNS